MDFIEFLKVNQTEKIDIRLFNPLSQEELYNAEKMLNVKMPLVLSKILLFSNGAIMGPFTILGINNKKIGNILNLNDGLINGENQNLFFSGSEHIDFSYNVDNQMIYKQDYSEIAPELIPIAKNFDDFFSSVATKISYIVDNDLSDEIYTFEDEELPENLRKWPMSY